MYEPQLLGRASRQELLYQLEPCPLMAKLDSIAPFESTIFTRFLIQVRSICKYLLPITHSIPIHEPRSAFQL
jgi:hypothetical protein